MGIYFIKATRSSILRLRISFSARSQSDLLRTKKWHRVRHLVVHILGFPSIKARAPKEPPGSILPISMKPRSVKVTGSTTSPAVYTFLISSSTLLKLRLLSFPTFANSECSYFTCDDILEENEWLSPSIDSSTSSSIVPLRVSKLNKGFYFYDPTSIDICVLYIL